MTNRAPVIDYRAVIGPPPPKRKPAPRPLVFVTPHDSYGVTQEAEPETPRPVPGQRVSDEDRARILALHDEVRAEMPTALVKDVVAAMRAREVIPWGESTIQKLIAPAERARRGDTDIAARNAAIRAAYEAIRPQHRSRSAACRALAPEYGLDETTITDIITRRGYDV